MTVKRDIGAIVYRKGKFLLVNRGHWDFIKAERNPYENDQNTIRKALEEIGINDAFFVRGFKETLNYYYRSDGWTVFKEVLFYVIETNIQKIKLNKKITDAEWLDYHRAFSKLQHLAARDVLRKAHFHMEKVKKT
ncbi:MAG: NUDIX domain-containing protein [Candidatus Woesearchaeota archaeon]